MRQRAHDMVRAGITTARDLGGGQWLELALRDEIAAGTQPGPRLICAGQPVTSPQGHCHFWGGEAEDSARAQASLASSVPIFFGPWWPLYFLRGFFSEYGAVRLALFLLAPALFTSAALALLGLVFFTSSICRSVTSITSLFVLNCIIAASWCVSKA